MSHEEYDDAHMEKLRKITWCKDRDYISAFHLPMGRRVWNCNICYSLVDDLYVVEHRKVCVKQPSSMDELNE